MEKNTNQIAVVYARESRKKNQRYNRQLMSLQISVIKKYCRKENIKTVAIIKEVISGGNNDLNTRTGLQEALNYLYSGKANILITSDVDRLTRNVDFMQDFIKNILSKYNYIAVNDNIDTRKYDESKKLLKKAKYAAKELATIRRRCKRSVEERINKKIYTGGRLKYGTNKTKVGKIYDNQSEQQIIEIMFDLRDMIGNTYQQIADALNILGYPPKYGTQWNRGTIYRIMKRVEKEKISCYKTKNNLYRVQLI